MDFTRWTYAAKVLDVHDGDTVHVELDLGLGVAKREHLRLVGIQAPEVGGPNVSAAEKAAGQAARGALLAMLGKASAVYVTTRKDTLEGRGRYLGILYAEDAAGRCVDLNAALVAKGHAVAYTGNGKAPKWGTDAWAAAKARA